jgi:hypothetical protein
LNDAEFEKISLACKEKFAAAANRRCKFERGRQLFVGTHNESPSIAVMRVNNPDRLAALIYAATQPQLHPALLRSSAMISQDFTQSPRF